MKQTVINVFLLRIKMFGMKVWSPASFHEIFRILYMGAHPNLQRELLEYFGEKLVYGSQCTKSSQILSRNIIATWVNLNSRYTDDVRSEGAVICRSPTLTDINTLIRDASNGMFEKAIDQIPRDTMLMLINVIYFKIAWKDKFPLSSTYTTKFLTTPVKMMKNSINAPHTNTGIALADKKEEFWVVMTMNTAEKYQTIISQRPSKVKVHVPRFEVEGSKDLTSHFKSEIPQLKEKNPMSGATSELHYLTQISHCCKFKVDEEGAEGAAVTSISYSRSYSRGDELIFNRPFRFFVVHRKTMEIVFQGTVSVEDCEKSDNVRPKSELGIRGGVRHSAYDGYRRLGYNHR